VKILQTVKYYYPSKGGMETVVKNIVEGVKCINNEVEFTIYANHHFQGLRKYENSGTTNIIKEFTPLLFKSQPLNIRYPKLPQLIFDNQIIHHHYPFPNMEVALLRNINLLKNKRLIITWHANIKNSRWDFIKTFYNPLIEKLLAQAKYIVVTSPQLFENSDILGKFEEKIKVIPLSFDPIYDIHGANAKTISLDKPRKILFVGKLRAYKGLSYLIDSIRNNDCLLTIVGEGEEEAKLKDKVSVLGLENRVSFFKDIDNRELDTIYQGADLFVLPSINEAEAFGVVQLEAMTHGLPVINTNLNSGVPYVSLNGVSGLTVEPRDAVSLEQAINTILNDKQLYETYSKNSLERSKLFTREKLANSYLELYQ
jgi:glycosyltransferase involved in cell wall biosynthesis